LPDVIVITGASRGIGAACARLLTNPGQLLVINYVNNVGAAEGVVNEVQAKGGHAIAVQGDVGSEVDILKLFEEADKHGKLTGLVNNAGIVAKAARVDEMSAERISKIFKVNVLGSFLCAREAVKRMSTKFGGKGGSIVNVSSAASRLGSAGQIGRAHV